MNGQETEKENLTEARAETKKAKAHVAASPGRAASTIGSNEGNYGAEAGRRRKANNAAEAEQIQKDQVAAREKINLQIGRLEKLKSLI